MAIQALSPLRVIRARLAAAKSRYAARPVLPAPSVQQLAERGQFMEPADLLALARAVHRG